MNPTVVLGIVCLSLVAGFVLGAFCAAAKQERIARERQARIARYRGQQ